MRRPVRASDVPRQRMARLFCALACAAGIGMARGGEPAPAPPAQPPRAHTAQPNVHVLAPMAMPGLGRVRTVRIYLPPGYGESHKRYPVIYLQDGQNLFDDATSFLGEWGVDEALNRLAKTRGLELIAVGIDNGGGEHRAEEMAPFVAKSRKADGDAYLAFVVDVVKPYVDAHYRTRTGRADTAIGGSSLGGLISHYALCRYPQVFGKGLLFSPSYWFTPQIYDYTAAHMPPAPTRIRFYAGGSEDEEMVGNMQRMIRLLEAHGFDRRRIASHVVQEAKHNETAWRAEFPAAIEWLFGAGGGR